MNFKIEVGVNVTQEGYELLKHFSQNNEIPKGCNYKTLEEMQYTGLVYRGDDPTYYYLTALGEYSLYAIEHHEMNRTF